MTTRTVPGWLRERASDRFAKMITLSQSELSEGAARATGLSDFGGDAYRHPLRILLNSIDKDARLTFRGRVLARRTLQQKLVNRLLIQRDLRQHPEILDTSIRRPLFITGLARTGTTFLHRLLAQDPNTRTLQLWELLSPSPPPDCRTYEEDPRRVALKRGLMLRKLLQSRPGRTRSMSIHESGADSPEECWPLFQNAFLAPIYSIFHNVVGYEKWLQKQDMCSAYGYYRQQLQLLLWHCSKERLVVKDPMHINYLDEVLSVFPDAHVVWTHRDPIRAVASGCSLIATVRRKSSRHVDLEKIGDFELETASRAVHRGMNARNGAESDRFIDVDYGALIRDPIGVVRKIYEHLGDTLANLAEERMRVWLMEDAGKRRKLPLHEYRLETYGLAADDVNRIFADYRERFCVPVENR